MSLPRFFCADLAPDAIALDPEQSRHATGSLRLRPGDAVMLFNGRGGEATCEIADTGSAGKKRCASVRVISRQQTPAPTHTLTLFVAGAKGPRLTTLVEKCTELGVGALHFTKWRRSVVHVSDNGLSKLHKTAIEACKQCGRNWLPQLIANQTVDDFLAFEGQRLIAHPDPTAPVLPKFATATVATALAIGPEGGLTDEEVANMQAAGAKPVRLGEHILRVETAALAAAAIWAARQ